MLPAIAFAATLGFLYLRAPDPPDPHAAGAAVYATQIPTSTPGPRPTPGPTRPPAPTATPDAQLAQRDDQRLQEVQRIKTGLDYYYSDKGMFPSTGGSIQTLCVYPNLDAGCQLQDYLRPMPSDPLLRNSSTFLYRSDGKRYLVYTELEVAGREPPCQEIVNARPQLNASYCITGEAP
jgi:type II secretion system (T2SS) protein G